MSDEDISTEAPRRRHGGPYTSKRKIPTISQYRDQRKEIKSEENAQNRQDDEEVDELDDKQGLKGKIVSTVENVFNPRSSEHLPGKIYESENRYAPTQDNSDRASDTEDSPPSVPEKDQTEDTASSQPKQQQSATEAAAGLLDPKDKRKAMKHNKRQEGGREVTDPVTHLPIVIHDVTSKDLKRAPANEPAPGAEEETYTGLAGAKKSQSRLDTEGEESQKGLRSMEKLYPPPNFADTKADLVKVYSFALIVGLGTLLALSTLIIVSWQLLNIRSLRKEGQKGESQPWTRLFVPIFLVTTLSGLTGSFVIWFLHGWLGKKIVTIWEDKVWDAARDAEEEEVNSQSSLPESTQWLNKLLASIWPLINPDLFTSLGDTLEDTMQASLPKKVRMVSVDDLGQGSESLRILGIRWLPTGAASRTVGKNGKLASPQNQEDNDRVGPNQGPMERSRDDDDNKTDDSNKDPDHNTESKTEEQDQENIDEGMEAEQGDFVNVEMAFAYRARSASRSLKTKANNAHLLIRFFLPGSIALPVWVEMRGIVGTMRLRLQLTPDPPFFGLATLTFLGQPKADLSCVPLSRHNLNIMDLPLISTFVQSSVDAALAEYVAPKSLTLDLKQMLAGDDFKKDTTARGIVAIRIRRAYGFKEGDSGIGPFKDGSADPYCTVSWGKFGKPMFSTRVILSQMEPFWDEWASVLVGPEEFNAEETLRVQLWDSDRSTADDDLGRVDLSIKELINSKKSKGQLMDRKDRLSGDTKGEKMPGTLEWSVGYFPKTRITSEQLANQSEEPGIKTPKDLEQRVSEVAEKKLREATAHDESKEIEQQKMQDYLEREENLIISSPPADDHPSGILSIQIHQITGLELEQTNKSRPDRGSKDDSDQEEEDSDDLPSSYCTVILNHAKIYRTRTKPKNAKPFFNAGTERFVRDWRTAEVIISVRDSRVHENDPLLGIIYLPLTKMFKHRSQVMDSFPLAGGIGYGRARVSLVFRSVELRLPKELIGWDYGTLEIRDAVTSTDLPSNLQNLRLRFSTSAAHGKMHTSGNSHDWHPKGKRRNLCLAVKDRYRNALLIEFRKAAVGPDSTPGWAVFWLKDISDEEEKTVKLKVWPRSVDMERGRTCCEFDPGNNQPLGELQFTLKFWRGLSGYHNRLADKGKQNDLRDVMEALDTVEDTQKHDDSDSDNTSFAGTNDDNTSTNSTSDSELSTPSSDNDTDTTSASRRQPESGSSIKASVKRHASRLIDGNQDTSSDGSRGPLDSARDYKKHRKQLHRQHRGLMQWKTVRSLDWAKTKVGNTKDEVVDKFRHSERGPGIETEV
ncbi:putative c2 calcium-dependent membrane targeting [Phaeomoniella chlamydospora]|uniref:Putative c2 calcium-dependent membrane targeting n=1 Tax=Phaeomoniella chlamydospora TaxID=158046 RepID=A0A0G2HLB8_PHACM|nr:putative c2 calcium-dependent membrane targeting [Phaeomoniella chlamydospora]